MPNELRGLINDYLAGQPSVEDRLMVGLTVGTFSRGEDARNFALTHLEEAYRQGNSLEQKRYILSEMVHFGQSDVAELIRQLPTDNPLLAQDVNDYQEIFALGAATIGNRTPESRTGSSSRDPAVCQKGGGRPLKERFIFFLRKHHGT